VFGSYCRLWLVFHAPINSDQSVVGLIAQGALHGHFTSCFTGQEYGGTAEAYVGSIAFAIFGQSGVVESLVVGALAALAALLTVRVARRMVPVTVARLIGALAWVGPAVTLRDSVRITGFRGVALVCGLGLVLATLRLLDGDLRLRNFVAIGLLAGVGWWSTPEILYFGLPVGLLLIAAGLRHPDLRRWLYGLPVGLACAAIGSLPWIWTNEHDGYLSIYQMSGSGGGYLGRIENFFRYTFPMQTGSIVADSARYVLGWFYWPALVLISAVIVGAVALCISKGGRSAAIGLTVAVFPFAYSLPSASSYWTDGRYAVYLTPLLALAVGIGVCEAVRRLKMREQTASSVVSAVVIISALLCAVGLVQLVHSERGQFTGNWGNPDAPTVAAITILEHDGITTGYAAYWVAYKLDFLSDGGLQVTTTGYDVDRDLAVEAAVERSENPAWLFVPLDVAASNGDQFGHPEMTVGPDSGEVDESQFLTTLRNRHVGYRVFNAGLIVAVVPDKLLSPYQLGIPGAFQGP
jgi:hypothetical protein